MQSAHEITYTASYVWTTRALQFIRVSMYVSWARVYRNGVEAKGNGKCNVLADVCEHTYVYLRSVWRYIACVCKMRFELEFGYSTYLICGKCTTLKSMCLLWRHYTIRPPTNTKTSTQCWAIEISCSKTNNRSDPCAHNK